MTVDIPGQATIWGLVWSEIGNGLGLDAKLHTIHRFVATEDESILYLRSCLLVSANLHQGVSCGGDKLYSGDTVYYVVALCKVG